MKILIVDDEKVSCQKLKIIMTNWGFCDEVADGASALEYFEKALQERAPYDIIMLDITLHELSGIDVLKQMRAFEQEIDLPSTKQAKIVMVTAHYDTDTVSKCAVAGCTDYIIKPFTKKIVREKLQKIFSEWLGEKESTGSVELG